MSEPVIPTVVEWHCAACRKSGMVALQDGADLLDREHAIGAAHSRLNSVCQLDNGCESIRVTHARPEVGAALRCLVCAHAKPWGVFDPRTGAAVCEGCRDAARAALATPEGTP